MEWLPTFLSALVAPVALYAQQRQQNRRETQREVREDARRDSATQAARVDARVQGRRDAYRRLAEAAYAYRQERAPQMLRVFKADAEIPSSPLEAVIEDVVLPTETFGVLGEALGVARLWSVGVARMSHVTETLGRTADDVEAALARRRLTTVQAGARAWLDFDNAIAEFLRAAESDLAAQSSD